MKTIFTLALLFVSFYSTEAYSHFSKAKILTVTVIDPFGNSLVGANIVVYKNGVFKSGTSTNENGVFKLIEDNCDVLSISYLGFKKVQLTIEDLLFDDLIIMEEVNYELETAVVTAKWSHTPKNWGCILTQRIDKQNIIPQANDIKNNLKTYPNPTSGPVQIIAAQDLKGFIEIFGGKGNRLESIAVNEYPISIDLSKYPSGIYFLRYNSNSSIEDIGKVVKID